MTISNIAVSPASTRATTSSSLNISYEVAISVGLTINPPSRWSQQGNEGYRARQGGNSNAPPKLKCVNHKGHEGSRRNSWFCFPLCTLVSFVVNAFFPVQLGSLLLPRVKTLHLCAIATFCHVAPAPPVVLALVQKQPFAGLRGAGAHKMHLLRCQQIRRRARDRPQRRIEIAIARVELPFEMSVTRHHVHVLRRVSNVPVQDHQRRSRHRLFVHQRPEDFIHRLPQPDR